MPAPKDPVANAEWRRKISEVNKGKTISEETRKKIGESHKGEKNYFYGKHLSEETRKKMSKAQKGEKSHCFGKPLSEETRKKISESEKGKIVKSRTVEHCKKLSKSLKGRIFTEETRKKMSEAQKGEKSHCFGKPLSKETRKKISESLKGEKCWSWKGGISFEPYCPKFRPEFKERVRIFFGRICVECSKIEVENGRKLNVHHVNFDKMVCCNDIKPLFVALCLSCHGKTNHDREYWEQHFTEIINEKYNGKCYFTKEEMENLGDFKC
jgi:hypothetical protein